MAQKQTDSTKKTTGEKKPNAQPAQNKTAAAAKPVTANKQTAQASKSAKSAPKQQEKLNITKSKTEGTKSTAKAEDKNPPKKTETPKTAPSATAAKPAAHTKTPLTDKETAKAEHTHKKTEQKTAAKADPVKEAAQENPSKASENNKKSAKSTQKGAGGKEKAGFIAAMKGFWDKSVSTVKGWFSNENGTDEDEHYKTEKKGFIAALRYNESIRLLVILIAAVLCIFFFTLAIGLGSQSCNGAKVTYADRYKAVTQVGYSSSYVGTVKRNVPKDEEMQNEGMLPEGKVYPTYGRNSASALGEDGRAAVIRESNYLCATGTANAGGGGGYTWMDKDGKLYSGTRAEPIPTLGLDNTTQRVLYKHTASVGMYGGNVSPDEPGVVKQVTMRPRGYNGYGVTGIYAPAGEVIKIQISDEDMTATGGLTIHIGQALYNGQANNIWLAKGQMQRMAVILNTMTVNKNNAEYDAKTKTWTGYVGSFLGGPLYIRNTSVKFTATISGGVNYSHFILGYTTPEEFAKNAKSSAPYFDLEVWDYGVLHSGPKVYAQNFSYDDIYKAAVLWEKISLVSTQRAKQGIVFIYDPFVAAGAAVAFPGRRSVNCPAGWMSGALNYSSFVNGGAWGNMHEYNHNFQGYGCGSGADGETTNNALNLVSYSLFTRISSARGIENYGASGLSGWNQYTCASWALNNVLAGHMNSTSGLCVYATFLHNFGQDAFMKSSFGRGLAYFQRWEDTVHYDMSYYSELTKAYYSLGSGFAEQLKAREKDFEYPVFVPVSSVYQTGRTYNYSYLNEDGALETEERSFTTMQPYKIKYGQDFTIDLSAYSATNGQYASGSVILPDDFDYTVKSVSQPANGKIVKVDDYHYTFKPDKNLRSGEFRVVLELTKKSTATDYAASLAPEKQEVELILEFEQSHEMNKFVLERTVYTYTEDNMYSDAVQAYENNFKGYTEVENKEHVNPTQNSNTDIWFVSPGFESRFPNATEDQMLVNNNNTVQVVNGKFYIQESGKYRIYLRGRKNCALYLSTDGNNFGTFDENGHFVKDQPAAKVVNGSGSGFYSSPETYCDITVTEDHTWIYFKSVLIVKQESSSYVGLGLTQWSQTMFTMEETYHNASGGAVESTEAEDYQYTKTSYKDYQGREVAYSRQDKGSNKIQYFKKVGNTYQESTEKEVSELTESKLIAPTGARYVNAYRNSYEQVTSEFNPDYFYTRTYTYSYIDETYYSTFDTVKDEEGNDVPLAKYTINAPGNYWSTGDILDGNTGTYYHSNRGASEKYPIVLTVDMGRTVTANSMEVFSRSGQPGAPKNFVLSVSDDGENYREIGSYENLNVTTFTGIKFDYTSFRYFTLSVSATSHSSNYFIVSQVRFSNSRSIMSGTARTVNDKMFTMKGKWSTPSVHSTFGHVFVGSKNASVSFTFEGNRLGIMSSKLYGTNFEVIIDGKRVKSLDLKKDDNDIRFSYISQELKQGRHKVTIKCLGKANIDSIVTW